MTDPTPGNILVVLAHPDDPEFFCGGSVARWTAGGARVTYCLLTRGDKGSDDPATDPDVLARTREGEQRNAAAILGVTEVLFLHHKDGTLQPDMELRKDIVRVIRQVKPDRVVTSGTEVLSGDGVNHPDHRAAGQATLAAIYPASGSGMYFPELLSPEGLAPHKVTEIYVAQTKDSNLTIDVTEFLPKKIAALLEHKSQIREPEKLGDRMREWMRDPHSPPEWPRYIEQFVRVTLT